MTVNELITALENFPQKVATNCESIMKTEVPVRTGNLRDHIKVDWMTNTSFFCGTDDVEYAKYVYHGRRGFGPTRKKVLHWYDGADIFTMHVGPVSANDYLKRTISRLRLYLTLH